MNVYVYINTFVMFDALCTLIYLILVTIRYKIGMTSVFADGENKRQ